MINEEFIRHIDWMEWHYNQEFQNPWDIKYDPKTNKYKANIDDYCMTIMHNFRSFVECWATLKYISLTGEHQDYYNRIKNVLTKICSDFHVFKTRKGVDRVKHLKRWIYEYRESNDLRTIKRDMAILNSFLNTNEEHVNEIAIHFQQNLDNIIEFIANDNYPVDKFINKHFL